MVVVVVVVVGGVIGSREFQHPVAQPEMPETTEKHYSLEFTETDFLAFRIWLKIKADLDS